MAVTSSDERDEYIRELYAGGWSAIEIGLETGLSRSQVHRVVAAGPPPPTDDDDFDAEVVRLAAMDSVDDDGVVRDWPVTCTGIVVGVGAAACEIRWLDARGRPRSELHVYRGLQELDNAGRYDEADVQRADIDRQIADAAAKQGLREHRDRLTGWWGWVRV